MRTVHRCLRGIDSKETGRGQWDLALIGGDILARDKRGSDGGQRVQQRRERRALERRALHRRLREGSRAILAVLVVQADADEVAVEDESTPRLCVPKSGASSRRR